MKNLTLDWSFIQYLQAVERRLTSLQQFSVVDLPVKGLPEGSTAYAIDGRKLAEGPGAGTGVPCYLSHGLWLRYSDDTQVGS